MNNASVPPPTVVPTTPKSMQSEVYAMFHASGPSAILISLFGVKVLISVVGIFLGGNLVYVTAKKKSLHSTCNMLIALYALCTMFQQANFFVTFATVVSGRNYIAYLPCFLLQMLPDFCAFTAFPLTFFVSVERFLSIFFPIWYKKRRQKHFLYCFVGISCLLGLYVFAQDVLTATSNPNLMVLCSVGPKVDASFFTFLILAMNLVSVASYASISVYIQYFAFAKFSSVQRRVIKCLFVLLLLEVFGWMLSVVVRLLLAPLFQIASNTFLSFLIINLTTNLAYIAMAATTPVLHRFSKEHREALDAHFQQMGRAIKRLLCPQNAVSVVTTVPPNAQRQLDGGELRRFGQGQNNPSSPSNWSTNGETGSE